MGQVHIYAPPVVNRAITATTCPDCNKRTRMIQFFQEWYGWHSTCLRCGRQWDGGEWLPLEFRRGVRADNIERAKTRWRRLSPRTAGAMLDALTTPPADTPTDTPEGDT